MVTSVRAYDEGQRGTITKIGRRETGRPGRNVGSAGEHSSPPNLSINSLPSSSYPEVIDKGSLLVSTTPLGFVG